MPDQWKKMKSREYMGGLFWRVEWLFFSDKISEFFWKEFMTESVVEK